MCLLWGLKFREVDIILGLMFCLQKLIFSLKISGGQKSKADYLGSLKNLV